MSYKIQESPDTGTYTRLDSATLLVKYTRRGVRTVQTVTTSVRMVSQSNGDSEPRDLVADATKTFDMHLRTTPPYWYRIG